MMADDDDVGVGIEFGVGAGGDVAHRHQEGIGQVGGLEFPRLADVEEEGCVLLRGGAELGEGLRSDLGVGEGFKDGGEDMGSSMSLQRGLRYLRQAYLGAKEAHLNNDSRVDLPPGRTANGYWDGAVLEKVIREGIDCGR